MVNSKALFHQWVKACLIKSSYANLGEVLCQQVSCLSSVAAPATAGYEGNGCDQ